MKKRLYILILLPVCLLACRNPISFEPGEDEQRQIVIESTISPGQNPTAKIHVTGSIDRQEPIYHPIEADEISVFIDGDKRMSYSLELDCFVREAYPIIEGESYSISATVQGIDVEPIFAETTVPFATEIKEANVNEVTFWAIGDDFFNELDVTVDLNQPDDPSSYFQLIPEILNPYLLADGIEEYMPIISKDIDIVSAQNAAESFIHKNGIFIDYSKLQDPSIDLNIRYSGNSSVFDLIDHVRFTLNTVNSEVMEYHEELDTEIRVSSLILDEPLISSSNVENGLGLFGAFSSSTSIMLIE